MHAQFKLHYISQALEFDMKRAFKLAPPTIFQLQRLKSFEYTFDYVIF